MSEAIAAPSRLIRWPEVHDLTGLPKSTLYDYIAAGTFPAPVKLSEDGRSVAWRESQVRAWIESRVTTRPTSVLGAEMSRPRTLDDLSRLLEAYEALDLACRLLDHCHPPYAIRPELAAIDRLNSEMEELR